MQYAMSKEVRTGRAVQGLVIEQEEKPVNKRIENRRNNLRRLRDSKEVGGAKALADLVGKPTTWISQIIGPNPTRPITEDTAREFEEKLGLRPGELDWPQPGSGAVEPVPAVAARDAAPGALSVSRDAAIIALLIGICRDDRITLPDLTFADIAAFAISDAIDTGKMPTPEKLRTLMALAKPR